MPLPPDRILALFPELGCGGCEVIESGMSGAVVLRVFGRNRAQLYLKAADEPAAAAHLAQEAQRLAWLLRAGVRVPRVLGIVKNSGVTALLMSALEGRIPSEHCGPSEVIARSLGAGLAGLHRLDPVHCPFDARLGSRIAQARAALDAGLVEPAEFDDANAGADPPLLFQRLLDCIPKAEDLVVTHGDATLANIVMSDDMQVGFIDCGRAGIADRYQDLALMARDIRETWEEGAEAAFWQGYGIARPDAEKVAFYELLEEFS